MSISSLLGNGWSFIKRYPADVFAAGVAGISGGILAHRAISLFNQRHATATSLLTGAIATIATLYTLIQQNRTLPPPKPLPLPLLARQANRWQTNDAARQREIPFLTYRMIDWQVQRKQIPLQVAYNKLQQYDLLHGFDNHFTQNIDVLLKTRNISPENAYAAYQTYRIVRNDRVQFNDALQRMRLHPTVAKNLSVRQETRWLSNTIYAAKSKTLRQQAYVTVPQDVKRNKSPGCQTVTWMEELTTGEVTRNLKSRGYNPAMLDMANPDEAGGGFIRGANAQEEKECEVSNLYEGLEAIRDRGEFPIPEFGVIVLPNVVFFRDAYGNFLPEVVQATVIAAAAYVNPPKHSKPHEEGTKEKMRAVLRAAIRNDNDSLVLSALGCGAFRNDLDTIIRLYKEVLAEPEFQGWFKAIVFAVINDHNGHVNAQAFKKAFGTLNIEKKAILSTQSEL